MIMRFSSHILTAILMACLLTSCGYSFGYREREMPGGQNQIAIPVFKNSTKIVGIEGAFTNALVQRFYRSQVARVISKETAPVVVEGIITDVTFEHGGQINGNNVDENSIDLPGNSVLTSEYRVNVATEVRLRRKSDDKILWQGRFEGERVMKAPQVGLAGINTANPLYAHSATIDLIGKMAVDMMGDAHDRMTENF